MQFKDLSWPLRLAALGGWFTFISWTFILLMAVFYLLGVPNGQ